MKYFNDQYFNGNKLRDVGAPSQGTDAANKTYVDQSIAGLDLQCPSVACETAASTQAKVGKCKDFSLNNPCYVFVNIKNANSYDGKITLNINSTGAKDVYINGTVSSSTNKTLPAGTYIVYYNGQYHFRTDGKLNINGVPFGGSYNDLTNRPSLATVATSGSYNDLNNKPTIPIVPTNVSSFTNDAGYITASDVPSEVLWCTYNSTFGTVSGLTAAQIISAKSNNQIVFCKIFDAVLVCTVASDSFIVFSCINCAASSSSTSTTISNKHITLLVWTSSNQYWTFKDIVLQEQLVGSGTGQNIKTVNNQSLLGSGNINITTPDFTHTANTTVSTSTKTITYAAGARGSQMISISADLALTFAVNNLSDNYLWIKNTGSSEVDITISAVTKSGGTNVSNVYLPSDGISIPAGKVCEIGIVVNADGAFITSRSDLSL